MATNSMAPAARGQEWSVQPRGQSHGEETEDRAERLGERGDDCRAEQGAFPPGPNGGQDDHELLGQVVQRDRQRDEDAERVRRDVGVGEREALGNVVQDHAQRHERRRPAAGPGSGRPVSSERWMCGMIRCASQSRPAPRAADVSAGPMPVLAIAAGPSSRTEIRIMSPAENPIPAAIARGLSRSTSASPTPREAVKHDSSESRTTASAVSFTCLDRRRRPRSGSQHLAQRVQEARVVGGSDVVIRMKPGPRRTSPSGFTRMLRAAERARDARGVVRREVGEEEVRLARERANAHLRAARRRARRSIRAASRHAR